MMTPPKVVSAVSFTVMVAAATADGLTTFPLATRALPVPDDSRLLTVVLFPYRKNRALLPAAGFISTLLDCDSAEAFLRYTEPRWISRRPEKVFAPPSTSGTSMFDQLFWAMKVMPPVPMIGPRICASVSFG